MPRQTSALSLLLVVLLGVGVQGLSFDDLSPTAKIDKKLAKYCKIPGLEFLCPDEPTVSTSADSADTSDSADGRRRLRA